MRGRYPDSEGDVSRDGVRIHYEVFGSGDRTLLLLPTWSIIHSRHWKGQVPYFARHYRVIAFDGRGNGLSDRPQDAADYTDDAFGADAVAVMDATNTSRATVMGLSAGSRYALLLAAERPSASRQRYSSGRRCRSHPVSSTVRRHLIASTNLRSSTRIGPSSIATTG